MSHAPLSVVISVAVVQSIDDSLNGVGSWTPGHAYSGACLVIGVGEKGAPFRAGLSGVVSEVVVGGSVAEVGATVVVVVGPAVVRAIGPTVPAGSSAVLRVVKTHARQVVRPSAVGTLQQTPTSPVVSKSLTVVGVGYWAIGHASPAVVLPEVGRRTHANAQHDCFVARTVVGPERSGVLGAERDAERHSGGVVAPGIPVAQRHAC